MTLRPRPALAILGFVALISACGQTAPKQPSVSYRIELDGSPAFEPAAVEAALTPIPHVEAVRVDSTAGQIWLDTHGRKAIPRTRVESALQPLSLVVAQYEEPQAVFHELKVGGGG